MIPRLASNILNHSFPKSDSSEKGPLPIENWIVVATVLAFATVAWFHVQSVSIWKDEVITLLATAGHEALDLSRGTLQFKPTANLV